MTDDIDRWLASGRPRTGADDGWARSAAGVRALAAVHEAAARRTVPARVLRRAVGRRLLLAAAVVAVLAIGGTSIDARDGRHLAGPPVPGRPVPALMALASYSSCADLLAGLRAHAAANIGVWRYPYDMIVPGAARSVMADGAAQAGYSTTNIQEAGVDEPDTVKTDGRRVVVLTGSTLRVIDAASRRVTGTLALGGGSAGAPGQLLLSGDRALVVFGSYDYGRPVALPWQPLPTGSTRFVLVELSGAPRVLGTLSAHGTYVDARMVGSTARLVVRSSPELVLPSQFGPSGPVRDWVTAARAAIASAPLRAWLPRYSITGPFGNASARTMACDRISHPADYTGLSMTDIYTVDLAGALGDSAPVGLAADGTTVYATASSLYLATSPHWTPTMTDVGAPLPPAGGMPIVPSAPARMDDQTQIHRFDISRSGVPRYLGSGTVPGHVLNQYAFSDYDGQLRVATSTDRSSGVYLLDVDTLRRTGAVTGLGRGEQIYAVRYAGPLAYVVTYRQIDPLFVLDLRDPARPRQTGELVMTGFSAYLHPAGDGRLIGVGQSGVGALQVALFDIADPSHPTRVARIVRNDAYGRSRVDPHAFLYWAATGLTVIPLSSPQSGGAASGLVLAVTRDAIRTVGLVRQPGNSWEGATRALVVDGSLWTLSDAGMRVSDPSTLARLAWIPLDAVR